MTAVPAVVLLSLAGALGAYLLLVFLRGERNRPMLIGTHLILGIGGAEALFLALRSANVAGAPHDASIVTLALGFIMVAIIAGFLGPIVGRRSRTKGTVALATHATLGGIGVALALYWISSYWSA
jgi:hypothetical protein